MPPLYPAPRFFAILPAAGYSRRMGQPKLLLPIGDQTVIARVIGELRSGGVTSVTVVVRQDDAALANEVQLAGGELVHPVVDPPQMRDSVVAAIDAIERLYCPTVNDWWVLTPADVPGLSAAMVHALLQAAAQSSADILTPRYSGQTGHPVLFRWPLVEAVRSLPADSGVNSLLQLGRFVIEDVLFDHIPAPRDMNTPAEYEQAVREAASLVNVTAATPDRPLEVCLSIDVARAAIEELIDAHQTILHCLGQLTESQIWNRSQPQLNSIGNLVLHLCGNLRQWAVCGLGMEPDTRFRQSEFNERGPIPSARLELMLSDTVAAAASTIRRVSATEWVRVRRVQGFDMTGVGVLLHTVPHFRGHTQEIVSATRSILGATYQFRWSPQTQEEGKPA